MQYLYSALKFEDAEVQIRRSEQPWGVIGQISRRRLFSDPIWVVSLFQHESSAENTVYNQPARSTQFGHPSVGRRNEYQPKGGDAMWLRNKGMYE